MEPNLTQPLARPDDIMIMPNVSWLYTGAEGPPIAAQQAALESYLANRALAGSGRAAHALVEERLRERIAKMLGLTSGDIALVSNASEAVNLLSLSLNLGPGDNVVLNDLEFPSMVQPWLRLAPQGINIRFARHVEWQIPSTAIQQLVDDRTKVIAVSHVSYISGWRHDLASLSAIADSVGAVLIVDATQSLGVVPVQGAYADAIVASSYKWLLGGHGLGILAWNRGRRELPEPPAVGWRSVAQIFTPDRLKSYQLHADARRFEVGFPSYPTIYALEASLRWLSSFGPENIEAHVLTLTGRLIRELKRRGYELMTSDVTSQRAGNVAVVMSEGDRVSRLLANEGVHVWGGDGRLRASLHLFNGHDDVDALLSLLDRFSPVHT